MKAVQIQVYGRVQGVGFRYFTVQTAGRLGVSGWVRNEADGSVNIYASSEESALDEFVKIISQGPPYSRVTEIVKNEVEVQADREPMQFKVLY